MPHPLPSDARIAILGAGCAGLTCAERLRDGGYHRVTVFEATGHAGGKICSVPYTPVPAGGRGLFEAGTVFFVPSPGWDLMLERYGVSRTCTRMPAVRLAEIATGRIAHPIRYSGGFGLVERTRQILRFLALLERFGPAADREPGLRAHVTDATAIPAARWFDEQGLSFVRQVLLPIAGGAQFGPLLDRVPAIYVIRLLTLLRRYTLRDRLRLAMPQLRAGHQEVWNRAAASHRVHFHEPVIALRRAHGIELDTPRGRYAFDAVINTLPPARFLDVADVTEEERDLLSRVRTLDRIVLTARVSGLGRRVFYAPRYGTEGVVPPGHPYLFYEVDPGSGVVTFHPYLDGGASEADAEIALRSVVHRLGGRVDSVLHRAVIRHWFPHFEEHDLRDRVYDRLEALQGRNATWHAGELFAGIGVPHGTEYALQLIARMTTPKATNPTTFPAEEAASPPPCPAPKRSTHPGPMLDATWIGLLLAATIGAMTFCFDSPRTCTALITSLACLSLLRFHERADLAAGIAGLILGPMAEFAATSAGLWEYAHPQWGTLPAWIFPMWWLFPVATRRLTGLAGADPPARGPALALGVMAVEIAWLCTWGNTQPLLASAGLLVLAAALLAPARSRADAVAMVCCGGVGPLAELIPMQVGAFSYPAGGWFGLPPWLPLGYAVFGLALLRVGAAFPLRLPPPASLPPRLDPTRPQRTPAAQGLEQRKAT